MYESQMRHQNEMSYAHMKESLNVPGLKKNKLRYSEYQRDELITPKTKGRKTIDFSQENENFSQRALKHLSYSHGGKRLQSDLQENELIRRRNKYDQRVYFGMEEAPSGGLKMKKMQFEMGRDLHENRRKNLHDRRKFDTNYSKYSGKNIDIYSTNFSPSEHYKKIMNNKGQRQRQKEEHKFVHWRIKQRNGCHQP